MGTRSTRQQREPEMSQLKDTIETAFEKGAEFTPTSTPEEIRNAVATVLQQLDTGEVRVAEKIGGCWRVNEWVKMAVLLSFRLNENGIMEGGETNYFDKVPMKY